MTSHSYTVLLSANPAATNNKGETVTKIKRRTQGKFTTKKQQQQQQPFLLQTGAKAIFSLLCAFYTHDNSKPERSFSCSIWLWHHFVYGKALNISKYGTLLASHTLAVSYLITSYFPLPVCSFNTVLNSCPSLLLIITGHSLSSSSQKRKETCKYMYFYICGCTYICVSMCVCV